MCVCVYLHRVTVLANNYLFLSRLFVLICARFLFDPAPEWSENDTFPVAGLRFRKVDRYKR